MKLIASLFVFALLVPLALGESKEEAKTANVFIEADGVVCIEAASTDSELGKWRKHSDASFKDWVAGFWGEACLQFVGNKEASGPPNSVLVYHIQINTPGKYKLALRGLEAPLETGEGDKGNDCYVRMAGQPEWRGKFTKHVLLGPSYQWSWNVKSEYAHHKFTIAEYELDKGIHRFEVAGRSKNFFLDRIVLYHDLPAEKAQDKKLKPSKRQVMTVGE
jgi:hypothetical protein